MADDAPPPVETPPPRGPSMLSTILATALVTVIAAAAGAADAVLLQKAPAATAAPAAAAETVTGTTPRKDDRIVVRELPPIVTNVAVPASTWIRLEAAIVFERDAVPEQDVLVREITADILAFLRTVSLPQLAGASGLQHLREDLNERVAIRSNARVRELLINTMVLQ